MADDPDIQLQERRRQGPRRLLRALSSADDGRSNAEVVRPWANGLDVTRRPRGMWIIDFGVDMALDEAALYERPFEYAKTNVLPARQENRLEAYAQRWWLHVEPRPAMRRAFNGLTRFLATPRLAKHRLFVWLPTATLPDSQLIVFARDDDSFLGYCTHTPMSCGAYASAPTARVTPRRPPLRPSPCPSPRQRRPRPSPPRLVS